MKIEDSTYDDYLKLNSKQPLHNTINVNSTSDISQLNNLIIYGPSGIGKYTQALNIIQQYSPSQLKYDRTMLLTFNKTPYYFKISDIHYEVDMSLLGCNSKLLWHDLYNQIVNIISSKQNKCGIILCKYFHLIHIELLETFYSYMQTLYNLNILIKFVLITENISYLPDNILNCCKHIKYPRPTRTTYNKCIKLNMNQTDNINNITNIKELKQHKLLSNDISSKLVGNKIVVYDNIINLILNYNAINYLTLRDYLYDICIFDLNINECVWYIIDELCKKDKIDLSKLTKILNDTYKFFKYYNNNYRPIYHLERYILYIIQVVHELQ